MKSDANLNSNADIGSYADTESNTSCLYSETAYYLWAFGIVVLFIVLTIFAILSAI
jgi:hypothetical protein